MRCRCRGARVAADARRRRLARVVVIGHEPYPSERVRCTTHDSSVRASASPECGRPRRDKRPAGRLQQPVPTPSAVSPSAQVSPQWPIVASAVRRARDATSAGVRARCPGAGAVVGGFATQRASPAPVMGPTACSSSSEKAESTSSDQTARGGAPFLDIVPRVLSGGERGLLGPVFHPDYETTAACSWPTPAARWRQRHRRVPRLGGAGSGGSGIRTRPPRRARSGGQPQRRRAGSFGPDGYLYISMGDGGGQNDQFGTPEPQQCAWQAPPREWTPLSRPRIRRIPPPTVRLGRRGAEIWAVGMRNPWRNELRPRVGRPVHRGRRRRVVGGDRPTAGGRAGGLNYGWPVMEGRHCLAGSCTVTGYVQPIAEYDHASAARSSAGTSTAARPSPRSRASIPSGTGAAASCSPSRSTRHDHAQDRSPHRDAGELVRRGRLGRDLLVDFAAGGLYHVVVP